MKQQKLIKQIEYKIPKINYFKLGLGGLISYIVVCFLLVKTLYDWYLITSSTIIYNIVFGFMYYFFIRDKKLYIIKEDENEQPKTKPKLDKPENVKEEIKFKKVR